MYLITVTLRLIYRGMFGLFWLYANPEYMLIL